MVQSLEIAPAYGKRHRDNICCHNLHFSTVLTCGDSDIWHYEINILKHILWKESLNSDGHQFHQYQQNEQSLLIHDYQHTKICLIIWK